MKQVNKKKLEELTPLQREAYLKKLERLEKYKETHPLYFYNHPDYSTRPVHMKQMQFHAIMVERPLINKVALFGGNQSGKTTAGVADDWIQAVDLEILPQHLKMFKRYKPPFKCRVFTPDLQDTMQVVQDKFQELCPVSQMVGGSWESAYSKEERIARLKNGSYFQFMSYEQEVKKVGSATLHRVHFDEEPPLKFFEESLPRLMRYGGDMIFTMTPLEGLSWAYEKMWIASGGDNDLAKWLFINEHERKASIVVDMDDNPYLGDEQKESVLKEYDLSTSKARKEGRFVHFAGLIYNEFKEHVHVCDPYEHELENDKPFANINSNVIVGIDPGIRYTGLVWAGLDEHNRMYAFDEALLEGWTIKEVCEYIKRTNNYHEIEPIFNVIDPQARERSKQTGKTDQSEFTKYGIYTILGQKAWSTGVDQVKQRLRDRMLFIFRNCTGLRKEFTLYRYKEESNRTENEAKPAPVEKDDHRLDALRYIVMARPYLPAEIVIDERSDTQRKLDADKDRTANRPSMSEFGGGIYL